MTIREKIQQHTYQDDNYLDHALLRAGAIIIAGYIIGTLIGWFISR